jgi:putative FmdB family regulatory protein
MPTYTYKCDIHGEFEIEHSINEKLEDCPKCKEEGQEPHKVIRLITGGLGFILTGGGWAKDNYS